MRIQGSEVCCVKRLLVNPGQILSSVKQNTPGFCLLGVYDNTTNYFTCVMPWSFFDLLIYALIRQTSLHTFAQIGFVWSDLDSMQTLTLSFLSSSVRRTADRHPRADQRHGRRKNPIPGVSYLHYESDVPRHRGASGLKGARREWGGGWVWGSWEKQFSLMEFIRSVSPSLGDVWHLDMQWAGCKNSSFSPLVFPPWFFF